MLATLRHDPFLDVFLAPRARDPFFDLLAPSPFLAPAAPATRIDVTETEANYAVTVTAPGVRKEDLTVKLEEGNVLTIAGETKTDRMHVKFNRQVTLPYDSDLANASAAHADGILTIDVPKKAAQEARVLKITGAPSSEAAPAAADSES